MLTDLRNSLINAKNLLETSDFDFYIAQFDLVKVEEFATTHFGVQEVHNLLERNTPNSNNSKSTLSYELSIMSDNILTYTVEDYCMTQSLFHWYYSIEDNFVYKESELGIIDAPKGKEVTGQVRVAKISELPADIIKHLI